MAQDYAPEAEDLYADAGPVEAPAPEEPVDVEEPPVPEAEEAEAKGEDQTAVLPKEIFMGKDLKPGTRCEIEIVSVGEDGVQIKYVPHSKPALPKDSEMEELLA